MKQRLSHSLFYLCLILSLCAVCAACSQEPKDPDFRNIRWGMSVQEVKAAEGLPVAAEGPHDKPDEYFIKFENIKYLDQETVLRYFFWENECYNATYFFVNSDFQTYERILAFLSEEYGPGDFTEESIGKMASWNTGLVFIILNYRPKSEIKVSLRITSIYYMPFYVD